MSDQELESEVARANGRVSIGFKEAGRAEGVDGRGRVLVSDATVRDAKEAIQLAGAEITFEFDDMPNVVAQINPESVAALRRISSVEYVEPVLDGTYIAQDTTWNVKKVNAPAAWPSATGSGQKVLIIDSGVEQYAFDLNPAAIAICDGSSDAWDYHGHGTQVAGIAAALNNSTGIIGVAHGVALWAAKNGTYAPNAAATACGVQFGRSNGVAAINISSAYSPPLTALTDQINAAYYTDNILVVAAAGNSSGAVLYPASLTAVVAVSATTSSDGFASFSSYGAQVEISAPGESVLTTCFSSSICSASGTSFSAPAVAAAAALLKSYNSGWSAAEIRRRLLVGATDLGASGRDVYFGFGRLDVAASVSAAAPSPPSISIDGPTQVKPFVNCSWLADVTGGVSPFTYQWDVGGTVLGTSASLSFSNTSNHGESFTLRLSVTGADLAESTTTSSISVSNGAPVCPT